MTRMRSGPALALTAWAAITSWLVLGSWSRLVEDAERLPGRLLLVMAVVAATGAGLRRLGLEWPFTFSGQVLVAMLALQVQIAHAWLPTPTSVRATVTGVLHAADAAARFPSPVPADAPTILPLLLLGGVSVHLAVDLVAVSLRRPLAASLPLLAAWILPVSVLGTTGSKLLFALAAVSWLALLSADQRARRSGWGRTVAPPWLEAVSPGRSAVLIGAVAVVTAVALPPVLPHHAPVTVPGSGPGRSDRVSLDDPVADLRRNLVRGQDIDLVSVSVPAGDPAPAYVRLSVLDTFDGRVWRVGPRTWLAEDSTTSGSFPAAPALSLPGKRVPWQVGVTDAFDSDWLPTPRWTSALRTSDAWRYDRTQLDVHASPSGHGSAGERYSAEEYLPDLTADMLARHAADDAEKVAAFTTLPDNRPAWVRQLARRITRGATTDYARAVALQEWFQEHFSYSTATEPVTGFAALDDFLRRSRSGYCQQFAASMALLARELGLPARVSVGFLRPAQRSPSTWVFSAHDLHAWPEIWFDGVGWVGFEPTPTSHTGSVPPWSQPRTGPAPSAGPSATSAPTTKPKPDQKVPHESPSATADDHAWIVPVVAGVLVLLAGGAMLPRLLRRRQRHRRLASDDVEAWWAELHATAVDLDAPWSRGASPRVTAARLGRSDALTRVVDSVEQVRYAPDGRGTATRDDVASCLAALEAASTPRVVRRSRWWPRSLLRRG